MSEAEKKRRRTEAANAVTPLSVVDLVLLLKIPRRRYYCARFACDIARTSAHSTRFVDFCARYVLMLRALFSSGTKIRLLGPEVRSPHTFFLYRPMLVSPQNGTRLQVGSIYRLTCTHMASRSFRSGPCSTFSTIYFPLIPLFLTSNTPGSAKESSGSL